MTINAPTFIKIPRQDANSYPTRYEAFDHPRTLFEQRAAIVAFEQTGLMQGGGFEYAVFYAPIINAMFPHLTDGTYGEIVSYQGKEFLVSYHYTTPDALREQVNRGERVKTYAEALRLLRLWLGEIGEGEVIPPCR